MTPSTAAHVILGTGQLGLAIMNELVGQGEAVTVVNRSGKVKETLPAGVTLVQADLNDPAAVARVTQGAQVVYATAQPAYTEWPERFPPLMQAILAGVAQNGAKLVFGDNLYMYGPNNGKPLHEGLPYSATTRKGITRAQIARVLLDAHAAGRARVTIGRAADFYGPRCTDSTIGEIVFGAIVAGKTVNLLGNIDLPHTFSYIRDFAKGLVILGARPEADGQAWNIPNPPTLSARQFVTQIAQQAGMPLKIQVAGPFLVGVMALFNPMMREIKEMLYQGMEPYIVDHSRFVAAFGDISTPHEQAIAETLAWFKARAAAHA